MNQNTYYVVVPGLKSRTVTGYKGLAMIRAFLSQNPYPYLIYERPELGGSWEVYESQGDPEIINTIEESHLMEDPPDFQTFTLEGFPYCVQAAELWETLAEQGSLFSMLGLSSEELDKADLVFEMSGNMRDAPKRVKFKFALKGGEPVLLVFEIKDLQS